MTNTRYHFQNADAAWNFMLAMSGKQTITNYGIDAERLVNQYYVDIEG